MSQSAQVESIFFAALDRESPEARAKFLDDACGGDAEVRRLVQKMLNAHARVGNFLLEPAVERPQKASVPEDTQILNPTTQGDCAKAPRISDGALDRTDGEGSSDNEDITLDFLAPSTRLDALGRLGHYEVLQVLGKGGFGIVFRAFDETLQRVVAVKVLSPQLAATSPARKRFLREARSSAKVRHEHIVHVYAVEEQPLPYLVMEFVPGETLQRMLDRVGPLETDEVVAIGRQLAEGLAAAHAQGLVHRDIKPANILIETGPHLCVKITDFGLARAADDASVTQSGIIAGTPMYMAPEQARGEALDHRADLFSLGSVLYTMASGRPPFRASNTLAVLKRVTEDTPRPIREIIPEVPQWLCDIISQLHAKRPEDRIATAQEVADLLERGMSEMPTSVDIKKVSETVPAVVASPLQKIGPLNADHSAPAREIKPAPPRQPRSRTGRWSMVAVVLLLLVAGLGLTEAGGVTNVRATIVRLFSPEGTLLVEIDDPEVSVQIDGSELVIKGAGAQEIRLKPGNHKLEAIKNGKLVREELVTITNHGRQVVRVSREPSPEAMTASPDGKGSEPVAAQPSFDVAAWERSVAAMPAREQVKAFTARLQELNPGFDGRVEPTISEGVVTGLKFATEHVSDISPVAVFPMLTIFECCGDFSNYGKLGLLKDLSPLKGLPLRVFRCISAPISDLSPLRGMPLSDINIERTFVSDLSPLEGMPLRNLNIYTTPVSNLAPLRGLSLELLQATGTQVADLSPLEGMQLQVLHCVATPVRDLSPLKATRLQYLACDRTAIVDLSPLSGLPLRSLSFGYTKVSDLSPLKGMPLDSLNIQDIPVTDLSLLQGLPLKWLAVSLRSERDRTQVRAVSTLEVINDKPAAEFWKDVEAQEVAFKAWIQQVSTLPAEQQVVAVAAKLIERNPEFDGNVTHKIEGGAVTEFGFGTHVADISPVSALPGLTSFTCDQLGGGRVLSDLSPLKGMKLTSVGLYFTPVTDLSPLQGMPIHNLTLWGSQISDLTPLKDMPLTDLNCSVTRVTDLSQVNDIKTLTTLLLFQAPVADLARLKNKSIRKLDIGRTGVTDFNPLHDLQVTALIVRDMDLKDLSILKGLPLTSLDIHHTTATDLSPLKEMKLTELDCSVTKVSDLSPLTGMPLKKLIIYGTEVSDLTPMKGMELDEARFDPARITQGLDVLREMKSIKLIAPAVGDYRPASDFWAIFDMGGFKK